MLISASNVQPLPKNRAVHTSSMGMRLCTSRQYGNEAVYKQQYGNEAVYKQQYGNEAVYKQQYGNEA